MGFIEAYLMGAVLTYIYKWTFVYPDIFDKLLEEARRTKNLELSDRLGSTKYRLVSTAIILSMIWWMSLLGMLLLGVETYTERLEETYRDAGK